MNFKNILLKDVDKDLVILGYDEFEEFKVNIKDYPSIIITGETGSGKSILLDQVILQMINKYTSLDLELLLIDTSGVELNYYENLPFTKEAAINDEEKSIVLLSRVLNVIEKRKELLVSSNTKSVDEYNLKCEDKLPLLLIAIDDDKLLLRNKDMEKMLSGIITNIKNLNIMFVLATSDVYNEFFMRDDNILASILISFDYTNKMEANYANLEGSDNLKIGEFIVKKDNTLKKYNNYDFDDKLIDEVVSK